MATTLTTIGSTVTSTIGISTTTAATTETCGSEIWGYLVLGSNVLCYPLLFILIFILLIPLRRLSGEVRQLEQEFCRLWDDTLRRKPPAPVIRTITEAAFELIRRQTDRAAAIAAANQAPAVQFVGSLVVNPPK